MPSYDYACRDCGHRFSAMRPPTHATGHEVRCPRCGMGDADRIVDIATGNGEHMRETRVTFPELAFVAVTRGMLGAGIGILLSRRIPRDRRTAVGAALAAIGALTTIPIAIWVIRRRRALGANGMSSARMDSGEPAVAH